jgi:5'-nucleotidase
MNKLQILVTNDDGVFAPGIRFLIDVMKEFGQVTVMAPNKPQSGVGHAITFADPLKIKTIEKTDNYQEYSCNGTPVDCIKLAENIVYKKRPDLVVSGVNHGSNASINVIYSGTMAAVIEACIDEIPAIGFSIDTYSSKVNLEPSRQYIRKIVQGIIDKGMPQDICLNVNIPTTEEIKGMKLSRQAKASWREGFDSRTNPRGEDYHWLTGDFVVNDEGKDTDLEAIKNGYISLVPIQVDLTAYKAMEHFRFLEA